MHTVRFSAYSTSPRATVFPQPCPSIIRSRISHTSFPPDRINITNASCFIISLPPLYWFKLHYTTRYDLSTTCALFVVFEVCGYVVCSVGILSTHTLSLGLTYFYASYVSGCEVIGSGTSIRFWGCPISDVQIPQQVQLPEIDPTGLGDPVVFISKTTYVPRTLVRRVRTSKTNLEFTQAAIYRNGISHRL